MIVTLLGALVIVYGVFHVTDVEEQPRDIVYFEQSGNQYVPAFNERTQVEPLSTQKFKNIVRQAYDYSCGSAALTTLLDYYLGRNFQERHVMEGLLEYGETDKIVERRGFSLLDMKRLVTALGHPAGGFKASVDDLVELEHPAIVPIEYAGFKHFVIVRDVIDGRVFIADPAVGNISFSLIRFQEVWDRNVLFIVFPGDKKPINKLEITDEDLRFVDESTLNLVAFHENPQFITGIEHATSTELGGAQDYRISVTDSNGNAAVEIINGNPPGNSRLYFKRQ